MPRDGPRKERAKYVFKVFSVRVRVFKNRRWLTGLNRCDQILHFAGRHLGRLHDQQHIVISRRRFSVAALSPQRDRAGGIHRFDRVLFFELRNDLQSRNPNVLLVAPNNRSTNQRVGRDDADGLPLTASHRVNRPHQFVFDRHSVRQERQDDTFQSAGKRHAKNHVFVPVGSTRLAGDSDWANAVPFFGKDRLLAVRLHILIERHLDSVPAQHIELTQQIHQIVASLHKFGRHVAADVRFNLDRRAIVIGIRRQFVKHSDRRIRQGTDLRIRNIGTKPVQWSVLHKQHSGHRRHDQQSGSNDIVPEQRRAITTAQPVSASDQNQAQVDPDHD